MGQHLSIGRVIREGVMFILVRFDERSEDAKIILFVGIGMLVVFVTWLS